MLHILQIMTQRSVKVKAVLSGRVFSLSKASTHSKPADATSGCRHLITAACGPGAHDEACKTVVQSCP